MCLLISAQKNCITFWIKSNPIISERLSMYKHKATMTDRRHQILFLIAKVYNNKQIARKMGLTLSNTRMQKWRLYCYLGEIHTAIDAVYMGLQMGLLRESDLAEPIREEIYDNEAEKQVFGYTPAW